MQSIVDFLGGFLDKIQEVYNLSLTALTSFVNEINAVSADLEIATQAIESGNTSTYGIEIIDFIGAYRWLVGDIIFNASYLIIVIGICYTIYRLVVIIKDNTISGDSLLSKLKFIFK